MPYASFRNIAHAAAVVLLVSIAASAHAQLRVVSYNTLDKPVNATDNTQFDAIFSAIAATDRNGIAKRVDIVALQEQSRLLVNGSILDTSINIANRLNTVHGVSSYEHSLIGSGADLVAVVYDSSTVELLGATDFTAGTRQVQRAHFRPVGYTSTDAEFYLYDAHLNASSASTRASEVTNILGNAEPLATSLNGAGNAANFIYAGDFNFGSSFESGYTDLTDTGVAEAFDPINLASWPNSGNAIHMTQSTRVSSLPDGGAPGGMDDRFDLQLVTDDLLDGEGLSYIGPTSAGFTGSEHSYQAFGNDGVSWNQAINNTLVGRSQSATVINALHDFSDHLPVIADYQLPARMAALADSAPATVNLGDTVDLDVTVFNIPSVIAAIGADELDYTITTSGDLTGSFSGTEAALGSGSIHQVGLDTSSAGLKSGVITVTTTSLAAQNTLFTFPINFEVLSTLLPGDANGDGTVDLLDLDILGTNFGLTPATFAQGDFNGDNTVDLLDLDILGTNFGATSPSTSVPEPATILLALIALCGLKRSRT